MRRLLVTLDTNQLDADRIQTLRSAIEVPVEFACVSVSERERGASFTADLTVVTETGVWDESVWDEGVWGPSIPGPAVVGEGRVGEAVIGDAQTVDVFETALSIISNGSFPAVGKRESLTDGQRRQLRDAMIFAAHVRERRDVFVTLDERGFVRDGRRAQLESLGSTRIMTADELVRTSQADQLRLLGEP